MSSVLEEVIAIRSLLKNPLPQSPSFENIVDAMEAEYLLATNQTNNKGNAWQKDSVIFQTVAGISEYQIEVDDNNFDKALVVTTIPSDANQFPEYVLEFTEVENITKEWAWKGQGKGQYMRSSHDSQLIAFFHKLTDDGDEIWCEIRPTPSKSQRYKIMYQSADWWSKVFNTTDNFEFKLPYAPHKHYFRTLIAESLLYRCRWSMDKQADITEKQEIGMTLERNLARYKPAFDEWIDTLVVPDVIQGTAWIDCI